MRDYKYDPNARDYKYTLHKGFIVKFLARNVKRLKKTFRNRRFSVIALKIRRFNSITNFAK